MVALHEETVYLKRETLEEARARFLLNYRARCCDPSLAWFNDNIQPLLKIAVPAPRPTRSKKRQHSNIKLKPLPLTEDADLEPVPWGKLPEYYLGDDEYTLVRPGSDTEALV